MKSTVNGSISRCLARALTHLKATRAHRGDSPLQFGWENTKIFRTYRGLRNHRFRGPKGRKICLKGLKYLAEHEPATHALPSAFRGGWGFLSGYVFDVPWPVQALGASRAACISRRRAPWLGQGQWRRAARARARKRAGEAEGQGARMGEAECAGAAGQAGAG